MGVNGLAHHKEVHRARAQAELNGQEFDPSGPAPEGWMKTKDVAEVFRTTPIGVAHARKRGELCAVESRANCDDANAPTQGRGRLYKKEDIERIVMIRDACKLPLRYACQVFAAHKNGVLRL